MNSDGGWVDGSGLGLLYGTLFGVMICLSKGSAAWQHAKFIVPTSAVTGALSGALIAGSPSSLLSGCAFVLGIETSRICRRK
jgi:hypothetical protein